MTSFPPYIDGDRAAQERYAILQLQDALRLLSDPTLLPSGVWDTKSIAAMERFQSENGLTVTGLASLADWEAVLAVRLAYEEATARGYEGYLPDPLESGGVLLPGERDEAVTVVQLLLNRFLTLQREGEPLVLSGLYDEPTALALRRFRRYAHLPDEDRIDLPLFRRLSALSRAAVLRPE